MWPSSKFPVDLASFTEEFLNGKLHFLCSVLTRFLVNVPISITWKKQFKQIGLTIIMYFTKTSVISSRCCLFIINLHFVKYQNFT